MPLECIENPVYQKEFMSRFDKTVMHVLDCSETNREEYSKTRAITLSKMIKLISPPIIPLVASKLKK